MTEHAALLTEDAKRGLRAGRGDLDTRAVSRASERGGLSGAVVLRIGRFVASRGHDAEALYQSFDLSTATLSSRDARVPYSVVEALGERAGEVTGARDIGLELGRSVAHPESLTDAGMLLLMASATVESALTRAVRLQAFWGDGARTTLLPAEDGVRVRYLHPAGDAAPSRHIDECAMAELVCGIRFLTDRDVRPRVVRFRHLAPADTSVHDDIFHAPLSFGAEHTELELDRTTLALPMRAAHDVYREIFEREVERAIERRPRARALSLQVRTLLEGAIDEPDDALLRVARALRTSARTLQRRLRDEGTSFESIVRGLRLETADGYLAEGRPIKEIAARLGYAEPSAFHRAYKRWTGRTPDERRRQQ